LSTKSRRLSALESGYPPPCSQPIHSAPCHHGHVPGFNADSYLRQTAERWIRQPHGTSGLPWDPVLAAAAAALVAVRATTPAAARPIVDEYRQALALREKSYRHLLARRPTHAAGPAPPPRLNQF